MSSTTTSGPVMNNPAALDRIGEVEHILEKGAHLLHELVDRVAHRTEGDRLGLHQLVAEIFGGIGQAQAQAAVTDPIAYAEARDNGAYDVPEEVRPVDPSQARIAELEAELAAMRTAQAPAPTPPAAAAPESAGATGGPAVMPPAVSVTPPQSGLSQTTTDPNQAASQAPPVVPPTAATGENAPAAYTDPTAADVPGAGDGTTS